MGKFKAFGKLLVLRTLRPINKHHPTINQKLTKTQLDGTIVWQKNGNFGQDPSLAYRPTWFAVPPDSKYIYLCDGYGSNNVYVFDRNDGADPNASDDTCRR